MLTAATESTLKKIEQFMDYAATNPEAIITYRVSDMMLTTHSNASYLSEPKAQSKAGGHFFMSTNTAFPPNNGAVHNMAQIFKHVTSSTMETELGAFFVNSKLATQLQQMLAEMGHPQPSTPVQTNNSTAYGVVTHKIIPQEMKAMDMQFHWLHDKGQQQNF